MSAPRGMYKPSQWRIAYNKFDKLITLHEGNITTMSEETGIKYPALEALLRDLKLITRCQQIRIKANKKTLQTCKYVLPESERTCFYSEEALE